MTRARDSNAPASSSPSTTLGTAYPTAPNNATISMAPNPRKTRANAQCRGLQLCSCPRGVAPLLPAVTRAPRDIHVHVCHGGAAWEREHLLFRDYLWEQAETRDAYSRANVPPSRGGPTTAAPTPTPRPTLSPR